jgi:hypothetical protein
LLIPLQKKPSTSLAVDLFSSAWHHTKSSFTFVAPSFLPSSSCFVLRQFFCCSSCSVSRKEVSPSTKHLLANGKRQAIWTDRQIKYCRSCTFLSFPLNWLSAGTAIPFTSLVGPSVVRVQCPNSAVLDQLVTISHVQQTPSKSGNKPA